MQYVETSAKNSTNIEQVFKDMNKQFLADTAIVTAAAAVPPPAPTPAAPASNSSFILPESHVGTDKNAEIINYNR